MDSNSTFKEIQNKNHVVFKQVFEDLYGDLVIYANKYLFQIGSSEDVVQEVFIYLWENAGKINIKSSLKNYLYAMVRNRCLNILKTIKITDISYSYELQTIIETNYTPDYFPHEERKTNYVLMTEVLDSLPTKMRTIVMLRFMKNYKYSEIADELGVSVNTIKTQLKRAKQKFEELAISILLLLSFLY